jgi:hypothetical protein
VLDGEIGGPAQESRVAPEVALGDLFHLFSASSHANAALSSVAKSSRLLLVVGVNAQLEVM